MIKVSTGIPSPSGQCKHDLWTFPLLFHLLLHVCPPTVDITEDITEVEEEVGFYCEAQAKDQASVG